MPVFLLSLWLLAATAHADPKSHYLIHCMGCHLIDGQGSPPDVPAFTPSMASLLNTPEGRGYLVRVPGAAQSPLNDAELAGVLNWMLENFSQLDPDNYTHYTGSEVAAYREQRLAEPMKMRRQLLQEP